MTMTMIPGDPEEWWHPDNWVDQDEEIRWDEADRADIAIKEIKEERYFNE